MTNCEYIPAVDESYGLFLRFDQPYWIALRRIPIERIKIDKSLMSFANEVCPEMVETIVHQFDTYQWLPITINDNYFLLDGQHPLDGQHRLAASQCMNP